MKILGIEFDDRATMGEVEMELKRRHLNPENKVIPILFLDEKERISLCEEYKNKSAQELIDICKEV